MPVPPGATAGSAGPPRDPGTGTSGRGARSRTAGGTGPRTHMIDFAGHECRPGTLLWIRPGQVHRYAPEAGMQARLVLFTPDFPSPSAARGLVDDPHGPAHWQVSGPDRAELALHTDLIAAAHAVHERQSATELLRHLLTALLLRIALLPGPERGPAPAGAAELLARFRAALEETYADHRSVAAHAAALNTTPKTLTRACRQGAGMSAKAVIDARVALEAKRLLVHTDLSAAAIGRRLGFTEAANFGKFFTRATGQSPGDFRRGPSVTAAGPE
ncbi:helix-turn-helix domain-containing protein [Streptomyces morookaense]|nr:AraC family transcriptional regulator [Streptomyces morookaense]